MLKWLHNKYKGLSLDLLTSSKRQCTLSSTLLELDSFLSNNPSDNSSWKSIRSRILHDLNTVLHDKQHKGKSALFYLVDSPAGRELLKGDAILRGKISVEGLHAVVTDGEDKGLSPLYCLAGSVEGKQLLTYDKNLRAKITVEGLNAVITEGPAKGSSILMVLVYSCFKACKLLNDSELRSKITDVGLNAAIAEGPHKGISALFCLVCCPEGLQLLKNYADLRGKITSERLNSVINKKDFEGYSVLFYLISDSTGIGLNLLKNDTTLRGKITADGLNATIPASSDKGKSPLFNLVTTPMGLQLFMDDARLRGKVTTKGLNTLIYNSKFSRYSVLYVLTSKNVGIKLLARDEVLRGKITAVGLNAITRGTISGRSPLFFLAKNELGIQLLRDDKVLNDKISLSSLVFTFLISNNATVTRYSVLAHILGEDSRHAILFANVRLMAQITDCITSRITPCEGSLQTVSEQSMADYLVMIMSEKTPKRFKAILDTIGVARDAFTTYFKKHAQLLWMLAKSIDGQNILKTYTTFYPKKMHHAFFAPDIVRNSVNDTGNQNSDVVIDQISQDLVINPAKITNEDINHHEYRDIYWWLLANRTHPITRLSVLEVGQDPDDILVLDEVKMQAIKDLLKTWLYENMHEKFVDIIKAQDGVDFLFAFSDIVKNLESSVLQQSIVVDDNTLTLDEYLQCSENGRELCRVIYGHNERNSSISVCGFFDDNTDVNQNPSRSNHPK